MVLPRLVGSASADSSRSAASVGEGGAIARARTSGRTAREKKERAVPPWRPVGSSEGTAFCCRTKAAERARSAAVDESNLQERSRARNEQESCS
eukprot:scaffold87715_cov32-Tisochrysis_lutea.AAC.8